MKKLLLASLVLLTASSIHSSAPLWKQAHKVLQTPAALVTTGTSSVALYYQYFKKNNEIASIQEQLEQVLQELEKKNMLEDPAQVREFLTKIKSLKFESELYFKGGVTATILFILGLISCSGGDNRSCYCSNDETRSGTHSGGSGGDNSSKRYCGIKICGCFIPLCPIEEEERELEPVQSTEKKHEPVHQTGRNRERVFA